MSKKTVHYREVSPIQIGERAFVATIDHPDLGPRQSYPDIAAITTPVINYDPVTGVFETANTIYKPNLILG